MSKSSEYDPYADGELRGWSNDTLVSATRNALKEQDDKHRALNEIRNWIAALRAEADRRKGKKIG